MPPTLKYKLFKNIAMRKLMMAVAVALILPTMFSCNREDDEPVSESPAQRDTMQQMVINFTFPMAVSVQPMTRATLADAQLTDLWLFDYIDGSLVNTIHQTSEIGRASCRERVCLSV